MEETTAFVPVVTDGKIADESGTIYDLTKKVAEAAPALYSIAIMVAIAVIVVLLVKAMKKNGGKFMPFVVGILGYAYFGYLMYTIVMFFISIIPGVSGMIYGNEIAYLVVVMLVTAFLCVYGKYFLLTLLQRKYDTPGDALSYSVGFAFANVFITLFNWVSIISIVTTVNNVGGIINVEGLKDSPASMLSIAQQCANIEKGQDNILYQGMFLVLLIAFSTYSILVMYGVTKKKLSKIMVLAVMGVQWVLLLVNALANYGYINHLLSFVLAAFTVMASLRYIFMISKTELGDLLRPVGKKQDTIGKPQMMKNKNKGHQQFPKFK